MRVADMTWMQVEACLDQDDRCVLPLGSTEQHAYLSLAVDAILAERVAVDAARPLGVPVFPVVPYGLAPYFMGYPGTVTLKEDTHAALLTDILDSLYRPGFRRILVVNGHGGNAVSRPTVESWAQARSDVDLRWHDWWRAPRTMAAVRAIDEDASHASWMEGFPWTRIEGVEPPSDPKSPVDLSGRDELSPEAFRKRIGDGSFGGYYERPDEELLAVWAVAVEETAALLTQGW
ncbi:MAG: creatininase family protein [Gemmatimonadota bacterium]|jgi:creatinine amidohydrolase